MPIPRAGIECHFNVSQREARVGINSSSPFTALVGAFKYPGTNTSVTAAFFQKSGSVAEFVGKKLKMAA
jgi:hypothetical protein